MLEYCTQILKWHDFFFTIILPNHKSSKILQKQKKKKYYTKNKNPLTFLENLIFLFM